MDIVDAVRDSVKTNEGLTQKQVDWNAAKALSHAQQKAMRRGFRKVPTPVHVRNAKPCTCIHTPKHHRKSGGCRRNCPCQGGVRDAS